MAERVQVSQLARQLGVPARDVLAKLAELGEYVKSAASRVEPPVERRLRAAFPGAPPAEPAPAAICGIARSRQAHQEREQRIVQRVNDPLDPFYVQRRQVPRGPHKGAEPTGLRKLLLDEYAVPRSRGPRPRPPAKYWASEVDEVDRMTEPWANAMLSGMPLEHVAKWVRTLSVHDADKAAALFAEGIDPDELEDDIYSPFGHPSLIMRLSVGNISTTDFAAEVKRRRAG